MPDEVRDWPKADFLRSYLNRGDLLYDLKETLRQLRLAVDADTPARSVKAVPRRPRSTRRLANRLSEDQVRELVAAFEAGATRLELAERYGIGLTSVAKVLRKWREGQSQEGTA